MIIWIIVYVKVWLKIYVKASKLGMETAFWIMCFVYVHQRNFPFSSICDISRNHRWQCNQNWINIFWSKIINGNFNPGIVSLIEFSSRRATSDILLWMKFFIPIFWRLRLKIPRVFFVCATVSQSCVLIYR